MDAQPVDNPGDTLSRFGRFEAGRWRAVVADGPTLLERLAAGTVELSEEDVERLRVALAEDDEDDDEVEPNDLGIVVSDEVLPGNPPPAERTPVDTELPPPPNAAEFTMPVSFLEGWLTADNRYFEPGGIGRRALPWTLMAMRRNPDGGWGGHDAAVTAGRIDTAERFDASSTTNPETGQPYGAGVFAWRLGGWVVSDTEEAASTRTYVETGVLRGLSVDMSEARSEIEITEVDEDGWPLDGRERVTQGALMGATICPFPAFPGAYIEMTGRVTDAEGNVTDGTPAVPEPAEAASLAVVASGAAARARFAEVGMRPVRIVEGTGCTSCDDEQAGRAVVASGGGPLAPPAAWFDPPNFDGPTPLTLTEEGRIFGHYALRGTCHTGMQGICLTPEELASPDGEYPMFHLGAVRTAEGSLVSVGQITLGTGHASTDPRVSAWAAKEHYDNTGTAAADVRVGEDEFGFWLNGAVRPGVSPETVRELQAAKLSGDWREPIWDGGMRLVGLLACNVPGFPVERPHAVAASGRLRAVVAAGVASAPVRQSDRVEEIIAREVAKRMAPVDKLRARLALERIGIGRRAG
jgi:hypothetical protein